jgi:hypothetical protein
MPLTAAVLDAQADSFIALNISRSPDGWQASAERSRGAFSIGQGSTPSEAIADALRVAVAVPLAPPPY